MVVARDDDVGGDVGPERTGAPAFVRDVHGAVGVGHGPDGVEVAHSGPIARGLSLTVVNTGAAASASRQISTVAVATFMPMLLSL